MTSTELPRILVVEDSEEDRYCLSHILTREGYHVDCVEDGQAAVDYLKRHSAPQLILLDMMMPGVNGYEFLARVRRVSLWRKIPVVIVSAAADRITATGLGHSAVLNKPYQAEELVQLVRELCAVSRS